MKIKLNTPNKVSKLLLFTTIAIFAITNLNAQKATANKWFQYYIGGKKGYFIKTTTFTKSSMVENQKGRGDQWENQPVTVKVVDINQENEMEKIITEYGDSSYYVVTFKDFTINNAKVNLNSTEYKTIEEAKQAPTPDEKEFSNWYTEEGYKASLKKPTMPEMKKQDVIKLTQYIANKLKEIESKINNLSDEEKKAAGLGIALLISTAPSNYAEAKGYHAYKSLAVMERGMKKFKDDKDVKKILDSIKIK